VPSEQDDDAPVATVIAFPTSRPAPASPDHSEPPLHEVIGDVLRDERRAQERTLADVAADAFVSLPYLSEVERGLKEPSSDVLASICGALGISLADVLERSAGRLRARAQCHGRFQLLAA
jgi:hypothetical protein